MEERKTFKEWRKQQGTSVVFVAKLLGVSTQTMRNKENGITDFTFNEARKLLKLYNISIEQVLE